MKRIRAIADSAGAELVFVRQGGSHEIWSLDGGRLVIPRHRNINEHTANGVLAEARRLWGMSIDATGGGYRVEVVRSGNWWAISVPALRGVFSQAKRLDRVEKTAREAIAMMLDVDESEVGPIEVDVTPPAGTAELLDEARRSASIASDAAAAAARARLEAAQLLSRAGLPTRDIGELLGVSHQRVSQILSS